MIRICTILLFSALFMGQALAGDIFQDDHILLPAPIDDSDFIDNRSETMEIVIAPTNCHDGDWNIDVGENGPAVYYCENDEWIYQGDILYYNPEQPISTTDGVVMLDGITLPYDTELKPCDECAEIQSILERCMAIIPDPPMDVFEGKGLSYALATKSEMEKLRRDIEEMLRKLSTY